jgi:hypothetical protein
MTTIIVERRRPRVASGRDEPPNALVPEPIPVLESPAIDDGQREVAGRRRS